MVRSGQDWRHFENRRRATGKTEPVDSQKNAEPLPTPPSDAQPEALATITGTPTDDIVGETPGKTAENEALETASESNADLKEPASNGEAPN